MRLVAQILASAVTLAVIATLLTAVSARFEELVERAEWDQTVRFSDSDFSRLKVRGWPLWFVIHSPVGIRVVWSNFVVDAICWFVPSVSVVLIGYLFVVRKRRMASAA